MRRIIYVPTIHAAEDSHPALLKISPVELSREEKIRAYWTEIHRTVDNLDVGEEKFNIYSDSVCPGWEERSINRSLGPEAEIVRQLIHRGGRLVGTEDPRLLYSQYLAAKKIHKLDQVDIDGLSDNQKYSYYENQIKAQSEFALTAKRRDRSIASAIDNSLEENGLGFLFMGRAHGVQAFLPHDIRVAPLSRRITELCQEISSESYAKIMEDIRRFGRLRDELATQFRSRERQ